jgi:hypothetical protein
MQARSTAMKLPPPQLPIPRRMDPDGIGLTRVHRMVCARPLVDPARGPRRPPVDDTFKLRVVVPANDR